MNSNTRINGVKIQGKEITVGLGRDRNRVVIKWKGGGATFFAGKHGIEIAEEEPITVRIGLPLDICKEFGFTPRTLFIRMNLYRTLIGAYTGQGEWNIVYQPDEDDIGSEILEPLTKR